MTGKGQDNGSRNMWGGNYCCEGVMKMGNIVPRAGIEPTSLAFQASVVHYTT